MVVYLFWHWPEDPTGYEEGLEEFHRRLLGARLPGLRASATYRVGGLPWLGADRGYEDWYLVDGFADLATINQEAVAPGLRPLHDRLARAASGGIGGLYAVHAGAPDLNATAVTWISKPRGTEYADFYAGLPSTPCLLRRQLVLGPAPEFCFFGQLEQGLLARREPVFAAG